MNLHLYAYEIRRIIFLNFKDKEITGITLKILHRIYNNISLATSLLQLYSELHGGAKTDFSAWIDIFNFKKSSAIKKEGGEDRPV